MDKYTTSSKTELLAWLSQQDVTVPARTESRTSRHCERWGVFRLLATWANNDQISYPLTLAHQDKPDFLLYHNYRKIGVEFTEAVSEEWAATAALAKHLGKKLLLFMDHFKRGTPKRTTKERLKLIEDQPHCVGFVNDEPEQEWALRVMDCVIAKTNDFNKADFKKYNMNYLLIYDNLCLPNLEVEIAVEFVMAFINNYWREQGRYDKLFIDTGNQLLKICPSGWFMQEINNL